MSHLCSYSDDTAPPPLPPHGITVNSINVEYRPPVPPHRNIGVTANMAGQPPQQAVQKVGGKLIQLRCAKLDGTVSSLLSPKTQLNLGSRFSAFNDDFFTTFNAKCILNSRVVDNVDERSWKKANFSGMKESHVVGAAFVSTLDASLLLASRLSRDFLIKSRSRPEFSLNKFRFGGRDFIVGRLHFEDSFHVDWMTGCNDSLRAQTRNYASKNYRDNKLSSPDE